jgi:hypothetical protein
MSRYCRVFPALGHMAPSINFSPSPLAEIYFTLQYSEYALLFPQSCICLCAQKLRQNTLAYSILPVIAHAHTSTLGRTSSHIIRHNFPESLYGTRTRFPTSIKLSRTSSSMEIKWTFCERASVTVTYSASWNRFKG